MIDEYRNRLALTGYRPRTIAERIIVLRSFAEQLAPRSLRGAHRADVEAFLARPLAPESRRCYRSHLRAFYSWALEEGHISDDPTAKVPAIRVQRGTPRPIGGDDLAVALERAPARMRAWLLLMSLGGLRACEVAALRPADVLQVEGAALLYLRETKGGGTATVPAHPAVLAALARLRVDRSGLWWDVTAHHVSRKVSRYLHSLGLPCTGHQLRHFAGTSWYRESGHDLLTTQVLLRHATVASSQIYSQLDPTRPAQVVNLVEVPHVALAGRPPLKLV